MRLFLVMVAVGGCGTGTQPPASAGDAQTPGIGRADLEAWLGSGAYLSWHCESAPHDARPPGAHGRTRICSNDLVSGAGPGEFPVGAASVKELIGGDGTIGGYAVAVHLTAGTHGADWYWYERGGGGPAPNLTAGVGADGLGDGGPPQRVCASCHAGAGDGRFGHDFVYTQVR